METRILGNGPNASAVGFGCMGFLHAYGPATDDGEAVRLIRLAFGMGYRFFDTAETYGSPERPHVQTF